MGPHRSKMKAAGISRLTCPTLAPSKGAALVEAAPQAATEPVMPESTPATHAGHERPMTVEAAPVSEAAVAIEAAPVNDPTCKVWPRPIESGPMDDPPREVRPGSVERGPINDAADEIGPGPVIGRPVVNRPAIDHAWPIIIGRSGDGNDPAYDGVGTIEGGVRPIVGRINGRAKADREAEAARLRRSGGEPSAKSQSPGDHECDLFHFCSLR